jgi:hypothetical protein
MTHHSVSRIDFSNRKRLVSRKRSSSNRRRHCVTATRSRSRRCYHFILIVSFFLIIFVLIHHAILLFVLERSEFSCFPAGRASSSGISTSFSCSLDATFRASFSISNTTTRYKGL